MSTYQQFKIYNIRGYKKVVCVKYTSHQCHLNDGLNLPPKKGLGNITGLHFLK